MTICWFIHPSMTLNSLTEIASKISPGRNLDPSVHKQCIHFVQVNKKFMHQNNRNHWRLWHLMSPFKFSTMNLTVKMLADPGHRQYLVVCTRVDLRSIRCVYMSISDRHFIFVEIQMSPNLFISCLGKSWARTIQKCDSYNNIQLCTFWRKVARIFCS